ncbi:MAG: DUF3604 domain-containing protein [Myxococcales bacterium]|nr:DUF3604 domain-containing protein [Myxococcales bacterium]
MKTFTVRNVLVRAVSLLATVNEVACTEPEPELPPVVYVEPRDPCAAHSPLRRAFFGDLHVHTGLSFDAYAFDVRVTPEEAYRFARGQEIALPPLDGKGEGTRRVRLGRALDFAAVTDHSEFLGEVQTCITPSAKGYGSATCQRYRQGGGSAISNLGFKLALDDKQRFEDVCPPDGSGCTELLSATWQRLQAAAQGAYDKSSSCGFTSFVAYEYSGAPGLSTLHRNVIFRSDRVPLPVTHYEEPTPQGLWQALDGACRQARTGCDVLAIPHNSNESNGKMFRIEYPEGASLEEQKRLAQQRQSFEPVFEIYQHKGDSECRNGLSGVLGAPDEFCGFEKTLRKNVADCGEGTGTGGTARTGCLSRRDFVRFALLDGLREQQRIGVNPIQLGLIASTDTHNGSPGYVEESIFMGHRGLDDDTPEKLLGSGGLTIGGMEFSPGGLVGVWAEENSRPALFDGLKRRETFGTSGPRITVRFFGGFDLPPDLCSDPALVEKGYQKGVPMGGTLTAGSQSAPRFVVQAFRDPGDGRKPGTPLQVVQIIKGTLVAGSAQTKVFDVAGNRKNGATVDLATCALVGDGADSLCGTFTDPEFDKSQPAFYYVRVLENPSCRWNTQLCNALPAASRPAPCSDPEAPKTIQERAWASPIYYVPSPL